MPVATLFLAHLVNTYLADKETTQVWKHLLLKKVAAQPAQQDDDCEAEETGNPAKSVKSKAKPKAKTAKQAPHMGTRQDLYNLAEDTKKVTKVLELVVQRQKVTQPSATRHPLKSCTLCMTPVQ